MLIDIDVNVKTLEEITVAATKLDVKSAGQNYSDTELTFFLDFGVMEGSPEQFVPKREAILTIKGGPVLASLLSAVAPGVDSLLVVEWPDIIGQLITTLNNNPSLVDGENVILEYLPLVLLV